MSRSKRGFTIVELSVVIVIIGVLISLVALNFSRVQASARDTQRSARTTVLADALEKYYDINGEYPSCSALTQSADIVDTSVLPGIDPTALVTPMSGPASTNSISCADLTAPSTSPDVYAYVGDGSSDCATGASCLSWTLKYTDEATGTIKTITSRRNTLIATSGTSTLTASPSGFTQINLSWTAVTNAISYQLQQATNAAFTTGVVNTTVTGLSSSSTGLTTNTTYYFRVKANAAASQGVWSNTAVATTGGLATPSITISNVTSTSFKESWAAVPLATSYNIQCYDATTDSTWNPSCTTSTTGLNYTFSGLNQGHNYSVRVQAVQGAYTSSWANTSQTTLIDGPAAYTMSSSNSLAGGWNWLNATSNAVCPAGTTPSYDWYRNSNGTNSIWVSGSQYKTVGYALSWNETVILSVATRCTTGVTSSPFVWSNNTASMSLPWSSVWVTGIAYRQMGWGGTCPAYTTSSSYDWKVMANRGGWSAGANGVGYTSYSNQGVAWGDGDIRVRLHCNGPWGDAYADGWYTYGTGCAPTITTSWCTY